MADFMVQKMMPDTYDYTKLFGLWKGNGLDLYRMRYIHGKDRDAKLIEALVSENNETIHRNKLPKYATRVYKKKSSTEHLIVVKTWMKTNETSNTTCILHAFDMEKFLDKEGLIDTLHTMYTKGKILVKD